VDVRGVADKSAGDQITHHPDGGLDVHPVLDAECHVAGGLDQFFGPLGVGFERFLAEDVVAVLGGRLDVGEVQGVRRADVGGVVGVGRGAVLELLVRERVLDGLVLLGDALGFLRGGTDDDRRLEVVEFVRRRNGVVERPPAQPDHRETDGPLRGLGPVTRRELVEVRL